MGITQYHQTAIDYRANDATFGDTQYALMLQKLKRNFLSFPPVQEAARCVSLSVRPVLTHVGAVSDRLAGQHPIHVHLEALPPAGCVVSVSCAPAQNSVHLATGIRPGAYRV